MISKSPFPLAEDCPPPRGGCLRRRGNRSPRRENHTAIWRDLFGPMTDTAPRKHQDTDTRRTAKLLRQAGLRPTRQRLALGALLFEGEDRHVTAELLHAEAVAIGHYVSLATVYNTLHQFKRAGLLRELGIHVEGVPEPPEGTEISHIDVVVRVVTKDRSSPL